MVKFYSTGDLIFSKYFNYFHFFSLKEEKKKTFWLVLIWCPLRLFRLQIIIKC